MRPGAPLRRAVDEHRIPDLTTPVGSERRHHAFRRRTQGALAAQYDGAPETHQVLHAGAQAASTGKSLQVPRCSGSAAVEWLHQTRQPIAQVLVGVGQ